MTIMNEYFESQTIVQSHVMDLCGKTLQVDVEAPVTWQLDGGVVPMRTTVVFSLAALLDASSPEGWSILPPLIRRAVAALRSDQSVLGPSCNQLQVGP
jgi:hypothetical protein